jgi:hypothetical protein
LIHALLVLAVILLVIWFFGALIVHVAGGLINLLWIAIIVLAILWLLGFLRGRSTAV